MSHSPALWGSDGNLKLRLGPVECELRPQSQYPHPADGSRIPGRAEPTVRVARAARAGAPMTQAPLGGHR